MLTMLKIKALVISRQLMPRQSMSRGKIESRHNSRSRHRHDVASGGCARQPGRCVTPAGRPHHGDRTFVQVLSDATGPSLNRTTKPKSLGFGTLPTILLALCVLVMTVPPAHARAFNVTDVAASIANERLELEFDLDLSLSDEAIDALNHGIALYIIVEVELRRKRRLKRDSLLERSRKDVEIRYHGLSRRYLIQESGIGTVSSHLTIEQALNAISNNRQILIPVPELPTNQSIDYLIAVRTRLNNETLPNPLRFISKLLPSWRLDSGWTKWPVRY